MTSTTPTLRLHVASDLQAAFAEEVRDAAKTLFNRTADLKSCADVNMRQVEAGLSVSYEQLGRLGADADAANAALQTAARMARQAGLTPEDLAVLTTNPTRWVRVVVTRPAFERGEDGLLHVAPGVTA